MKRAASRTVSSWSRSPECCGFRGVFWVGRIFFSVFFFDYFFFEGTRPAASMRPPCLIYLSTSNNESHRAIDKSHVVIYMVEKQKQGVTLGRLPDKTRHATCIANGSIAGGFRPGAGLPSAHPSWFLDAMSDGRCF